MDASVSMKRHFRNLPLYDITKPLLNMELKAYGYIINELNEEISKLLSECFLSTASTYGLENKELLIGDVRDDLSIEDRRKMLSLREVIDSKSFSVSKIKQACESFTLASCKISEYPSLYIVSVEIYGEYSDAIKVWIKEQIRKIMPAHLSVYVAFNGYSWGFSDTKNNSFSYIDSLGYTWDEIDNLA